MHVERREPERSSAPSQTPPAAGQPTTAQLVPAPPAVPPATMHAAPADTTLARTLARAVQRRAPVDVDAAAATVARHAAASGGPVVAMLQRSNGNGAAPPPATQQQSVQILYTTDHAARVAALQAEIPGAGSDVVTTAPRAIQGLETIVFWGHGTSANLCDLTPDAMVKLIKQWKKLNASLKTVELITCNARHYAPGLDKAKGFTDSFAHQLKKALRAGTRSSTRDITLRALPTTLWGEKDAFSILLAETGSKSWVYITAPGKDDKLMQDAAFLVQTEPKPGGGRKSYKGDIAERAQKVLKEADPDRKWTMNYGYLKDLRRTLNVI